MKNLGALATVYKPPNSESTEGNRVESEECSERESCNSLRYLGMKVLQDVEHSIIE